MAQVHYLQHVPFEGLGSIEPWLIEQGHDISVTHLYAGDTLPPIDDIDWLIVMGGPMGIYDYDQHPWLKAEKQFIRACIDAGKTVLGICLGGQLIADVLGGKVTRNPHGEIGWFPIQVTDAGQQTAIGKQLQQAAEVFHWHGDTFAIPDGAIHLARSEGCDHQAFLYADKVLGLQFHLETTPAGAKALCQECGDEIGDGPWVQTPESMLASAQRFADANRQMTEILAVLNATL